jgi:hypothetical protein
MTAAALASPETGAGRAAARIATSSAPTAAKLEKQLAALPAAPKKPAPKKSDVDW